MNWIRTGLASCVVALAIGTAAAQSGGLTVKVVDQNNDPLPGATVTISHNAGGVPTTSYVTKADGIVDFPVLRGGGGYSLRVTFPGFSDQVIDDIRVKIGENSVYPIQVLPEITERVTVTARRSVVDLENATTSTKFSDTFIGDLPVPGRSYENILTLAPGVQDSDGDGDPIVHGSRERDFRAEVGGISNVDPLTGKRMSRVNLNTIEEIEVITAGAGVEFGRAQGGYARIVQKQGNNDHEGNFEFYFRSSLFDGTGARDDSALPDQDYDWFQPSVLFSGPIIRDRLWYRLSHDVRNIDVPINTGAGIVVQNVRERTHSDLITWQVSPRNKLGMQFDADPSDRNNVGVSSTRGPETAWREKRTSKTYRLNWTAAHSPKVLVESNLAWQELTSGRLPSTAGVLNTCLGDGAPAFLENAQCTNLTTGQTTGSFFQTLGDYSQRLTTRSDATLFGGRFWGMTHEFKLGVAVENERYFRDLQEFPRGSVFVATFGDDPDNEQDVEAVGIANFTVSVPQEDQVRATGTNWSFYARDQFKPRQNLTVTAGLRVSREEVNSEGRAQFDPQAEFQDYLAARAANPSEQITSIINRSFTAYEDTGNFIDTLVQLICVGSADLISCRNGVETGVSLGQAAFLQKLRAADDINIVNTNIEPSLSVSWSPWSSGRTILRASARRGYNQIPLIVPLQELEPAQANLGYLVNLSTGEVAPDGQVTPAVNVNVVARDLKTPYSDEWALTFERELFTETSLRVQYINRKYRDQIQDRDINRDTGDFGLCVRQLNPDQRPMIPSPGAGFELQDPFSGEIYTDTDPGIGDGRLDDCIGETERFEGAAGDGGGGPLDGRIGDLFRPDGVPDLYVQNPYWGSIYEIGNYNQHDYQGLVFELTRRQYRGWELQGSYTLSRAKGNGEDFFQFTGDDPSLTEDEFGYQSTDQRHVVKMTATTVTPWGVRLGGGVTWQSGLPYSLLQFKRSYTAKHPDLPSGYQPVSPRFAYPTGVRNDQRNASYWDVTLKATREFTIGRGMNMQLSAEIFNLLGDDTYRIYNNAADAGRQINGINESYFEFGRQWQLGMKLAF